MKWDPGKVVDLAAAGIFAGATGFAAAALLGGAAAMLAAPAFVLAYRGLRQIDPGGRHALPGFALAPVGAPVDMADDGTVVRLFARTSPTSEDRATPDAGQALSDALAQLKRSLR